MSGHTNNLNAEDLIKYIANDYFELSHDKAIWQRDEWSKICRNWIHKNLNDKQYPDIDKPDEIKEAIKNIEVLGEMSRSIDEHNNVDRYIQKLGDFYSDKDILTFVENDTIETISTDLIKEFSTKYECNSTLNISIVVEETNITKVYSVLENWSSIAHNKPNIYSAHYNSIKESLNDIRNKI